uniref:Uncharacterized protein n=1 Tax=Paramoeba aestuarina TaxID=180227 RepID=A0A7S4NYY7_9EUKA|mmetsp:Transcript_32730/g.51163  ORF Transcript_32730/g.51163 Transcript_32730/m.51163 type:complete len:229 (+) Transcript_32730:32-718(+)
MLTSTPLLFAFLCADTTHPAQPDHIVWRDALMTLFFQNIPAHVMSTITDGTITTATFCDFRGIVCNAHREIDEVRYSSTKGGNFNIRAVPNTVKYLRVSNSEQTFEISTRSFPKNLVHIDVCLNKITGRIDLTTLPIRLEHGAFDWNRLKGPITLEYLPPFLKVLKLQANAKIIQRTVYYDNLPVDIEQIFLVHEWERKRIKEVRAVNPEKVVTRPKFFGEMPAENVH